MNGHQWFDTDFQVTADTDNFIVETSIMWTNTSKRQLMGYNSSAYGYWGINNSGNYEMNGPSTIAASSTSYDSLTFVRNVTNRVQALYINNVVANSAKWVDQTSGKLSIGTLAQTGTTYSNFCKMQYFKIYQDGAMKYNLIPAKNSAGVAGMYDTVNNKFYISTAGTAFIAGAEV